MKRKNLIQMLQMPCGSDPKRRRIAEARNYHTNESERIEREEKEATEAYEASCEEWGKPKGPVKATANVWVYKAAMVMLLVMECLFGAVMASAMLELSEIAAALFGVLVTGVLYAAIRVAMEAFVVHGDQSPAEQMDTVRGILKVACISWVVCLVAVVLLSRTVTEDDPIMATALAVTLTALTVLSPLFAASISLMYQLASWGNQPAATMKACKKQREYLTALKTVCDQEAAKLGNDGREEKLGGEETSSTRRPVQPIHPMTSSAAAGD